MYTAIRCAFVLAAAVFSSSVFGDYVANRLDYVDPSNGSVAWIHVVQPIGDVISEYGTRKNGGCQHESTANSGVHRRPPFMFLRAIALAIAAAAGPGANAPVRPPQ